MDQKPDQPGPTRQHIIRTRIFLVLFFGLALLLSITTIAGSLGIWHSEDAAPPTAEAPAE